MTTTIDFYKGLNENSKLIVALDLPTVAKEVCQLNYGAHRLLSALVHELRKKQSEFISESNARSVQLGQRPLWSEADKISPLADAIEVALNKGFTY